MHESRPTNLSKDHVKTVSSSSITRKILQSSALSSFRCTKFPQVHQVTAGKELNGNFNHLIFVSTSQHINVFFRAISVKSRSTYITSACGRFCKWLTWKERERKHLVSGHVHSQVPSSHLLKVTGHNKHSPTFNNGTVYPVSSLPHYHYYYHCYYHHPYLRSSHSSSHHHHYHKHILNLILL